MPRPKGFWYPPGLIYDFAFRRMFRGFRRRVARTVESEGLYPWLDLCSGTGDQRKGVIRGGQRLNMEIRRRSRVVGVFPSSRVTSG